MAVLEIDGATCHFRMPGGHTVRAVDDVSISVERGETVALVGESGCGKSTLAKLVLGLAPLTAGAIRFEGEAVSGLRGQALKHYRRQVQAVFQDPYSSLNPRLRIASILSEPLTAHGIPRRQIGAKVAEALEMVGLPETAARLYPHEFSGGQRQRVAIARALILRPSLVVLDEPISALDVSIRAQILNLLQDLQGTLNLTYFVIAHDLALVRHMSDRVAVMYLGEIVESGESETLFDCPSHPYTQALLAAVPRPDPSHPRPSGHLAGEVSSAMNIPGGCRFHPRCPHATDACRATAPAAVEVSEGHRASCLLLAEDAVASR